MKLVPSFSKSSLRRKSRGHGDQGPLSSHAGSTRVQRPKEDAGPSSLSPLEHSLSSISTTMGLGESETSVMTELPQDLSADDLVTDQDSDSSATPPAQPMILRRKLSRSDLMASSRSLLSSTKKQGSYRSLGECDASSLQENDVVLFDQLGDLSMPVPLCSSANVYDVTPPRRSLVRDSQRPTVKIVIRHRVSHRSEYPNSTDYPTDATPTSIRVRHAAQTLRTRSESCGCIDSCRAEHLSGIPPEKQNVRYPFSVLSDLPKRSARYRVRVVRDDASSHDAADDAALPTDRRRRLRELLEDGETADRLRRDLLLAQASGVADSDDDTSVTHVLRKTSLR